MENLVALILLTALIALVLLWPVKDDTEEEERERDSWFDREWYEDSAGEHPAPVPQDDDDADDDQHGADEVTDDEDVEQPKHPDEED